MNQFINTIAVGAFFHFFILHHAVICSINSIFFLLGRKEGVFLSSLFSFFLVFLFSLFSILFFISIMKSETKAFIT